MGERRFKGLVHMRQLCGCRTWKHELQTWLCKSLTEQEIGEALEAGNSYICEYYE